MYDKKCSPTLRIDLGRNGVMFYVLESVFMSAMSLGCIVRRQGGIWMFSVYEYKIW